MKADLGAFLERVPFPCRNANKMDTCPLSALYLGGGTVTFKNAKLHLHTSMMHKKHADQHPNSRHKKAILQLYTEMTYTEQHPNIRHKKTLETSLKQMPKTEGRAWTLALGRAAATFPQKTTALYIFQFRSVFTHMLLFAGLSILPHFK